MNDGVFPRVDNSWESTELVEIDAASGEVLDRIPFETRKPIALYATPGRLWVRLVDDPPVRIALPVRP